MRQKKFVLSYSGGKDCVLALDRAIRQGGEPVGMMVTVNRAEQRSWFHHISSGMLRRLEQSLGIPLTFVETDGEHYEHDFEAALRRFKQQGVEAVVFGDIDIEEHYKWCHKRCENMRLESVFPLWGEKRGAVAWELIDRGFQAIITVVNTKQLDEKYLGKTLTKELAAQIVVDGADVCGENGEYHTLVVDGPLFQKPIDIPSKKIVRSGDHVYWEMEKMEKKTS